MKTIQTQVMNEVSKQAPKANMTAEQAAKRLQELRNKIWTIEELKIKGASK